MSTTTMSNPIGRDAYDSAVVDAPAGAVSWGAIFAGAAAAASLSLLLMILGVGLGLSSVSAWSGQGLTAATFGISTVLWLTFTQLAASGMGGYLAGRLRTRWTRTHSDEVYFRDTAHGFLAWAVASLVTAVMLSSAIGSIVSGGAQAGAAVASGAAATVAAAVPAAASAADSNGKGAGYYIDALFRRGMSDSSSSAPSAGAADTATPTATAPDAAASDAGTSSAASTGTAAASSTGTAAASSTTSMPAQAVSAMSGEEMAQASAEAARIFATSIADGKMSAEDTQYLAQMVAQRTGLSAAEAEKRVTETFTRMQTKLKEAETAARDAADKARKAAATASLWMFVSLLIGAFVASLMATFGGRQRDTV